MVEQLGTSAACMCHTVWEGCPFFIHVGRRGTIGVPTQPIEKSMLKKLMSGVRHVSKRYRFTAITLTAIASILSMLIKQLFTDQGNPINYVLMVVNVVLVILLIYAIRHDKRYYDEKLAAKKEYRDTINKIRKRKAEQHKLEPGANNAGDHPNECDKRRPPS
ncbi:hypothetical protein L2728_06140 [Shewanella chilikensis]|uniref:hypothetical protein n=1 Tax=Shewanella TaxID=22 RepID=UPI00200E6D1C|nr:hypothetical protein [Shewanella chilikensis]MCL1161466.1 hypothetical protein [Shewanella chilikensis]